MSNVGVLQIREVDAIRYPILKENNQFYFIYNNRKIKIKYDLLENDNIIIMDKSCKEADFIINLFAGFPFIYINGVKIKNDNNVIL